MRAGKLVVYPNPAGISITVSYILLQSNGALYVGDNAVSGCSFNTSLDILLTGRYTPRPLRCSVMRLRVTTGRKLCQIPCVIFLATKMPCNGITEFFVLAFRSDDDTPELAGFGRKMIAVAPFGTLVMVGEHRLSWTRLTQTITPGNHGDRPR